MLIALVSVVSCVKENHVENVVIRAVMEGGQTRTSFSDEGMFVWSEDEQIWLHTTAGHTVGTLISGAGTVNARFSYEKIAEVELTGRAVCPYNQDHTISADVLNVALPASYELGSTLSKTNALLYGVTNENSVKFNHLAGLMRFAFYDVPAGVDSFTLTLDKKINGIFPADLTADYPVVETVTTENASERTTTLYFDPLTSVSDIKLYVPLPIGTYNALEVTLYAGSQPVWTYSNAVRNTIERRTATVMPGIMLKLYEDQDDPESELFDYSLMGGHPRLLLREEDFGRIKQQIASDERIAAIHQIIIDRAEQHLTQGPIVYDKVGRRLLNECRKASERIIFLAYSYKLTGDSRYLAKAESTINEVSAFADWNQDEHYLDVAEMAIGVAIGIDWLYCDLKPETRTAAKMALKSYAFDTCLTECGDVFRKSMSNWNQVCTGGLIAAAIACYEEDKNAMAELIETLLENNKLHGMTMYNTDGNYSEGYTYWAYGTTYQVITMAALEKIFGHDGGLKASSDGFAKTGLWVMFMEGPSGNCFNFSDCNAPIYPRVPLWYIADYFKNPDLLYLELKKIDSGRYAIAFDERRFLPLIPIFADESLMRSNVQPPAQKIWYGGATVETNPTVLIHTDISDPQNDFYLAMKGGRSNVSHAHMDGGSFVYDAYGLRWAMDLGLQKYNGLEEYGIDLWNYGKTSTRWNVFRLNNFSHNVISVNNNIYHFQGGAFLDTKLYNEKPDVLGGRYTCYALNYNIGDDKDLASPSLTRTAELAPLDGSHSYELVVTDVLSSCPGKTPEIRWAMATPAAVEVLTDSCIQLTQEGVTLYLTASEASGSELRAFARPADDYISEWDEPNPGVSLVGFEGKMGSDQTWVLTTKLSPIR